MKQAMPLGVGIMWKDILVFADGSDEGLARLRVALDLARRHDAHLEAQVATPLPRRPEGPATSALLDAYQEVLSAAHARGASALAAVQALAPLGEAFSAGRCEVIFAGIRARVAVLARAHDLVIVGQPESGGHGDIDTEVLMGALLGGGGPCLMLPRWIKPHVLGKRALVAWKGTPQSARAVHAALPLLKGADIVRLLVVDPRAGEHGEDEQALARLATRLARHGVRVDAPGSAKSDYDDRVGRAIADEAEAFGADLMVMGGYGHARLTELFLGGVTRHMIDHARMPVLMAH
jgi:nucleotide-binding universal stress UspA family protein